MWRGVVCACCVRQATGVVSAVQVVGTCKLPISYGESRCQPRISFTSPLALTSPHHTFPYPTLPHYVPANGVHTKYQYSQGGRKRKLGEGGGGGTDADKGEGTANTADVAPTNGTNGTNGHGVVNSNGNGNGNGRDDETKAKATVNGSGGDKSKGGGGDGGGGAESIEDVVLKPPGPEDLLATYVLVGSDVL